jgi:UDP-N-acetylmuramate dehydrogenase
LINRYDAYDLSRRNTFGMKVSCRAYVEITDPEDLLTLDFDSLPQPVFVMGGGSNLLFTKDFPGTVLHLSNKGYTVLPDSLVRVGAGVVFDDFCAWAAEQGLWGPENLSLIPGEVGASAVQNIGAYGVEAKDIIDTVHAFDRNARTFVDIPGADCGYGYRTSLFKTDWKGRYIITAVTFRLSAVPRPRLDYGGVRKALEARFLDSASGSARNDKNTVISTKADGSASVISTKVEDRVEKSVTPQMIRETVIGIRREKLPDPEEIGSAGSFFCNPVIERDHFEKIVAIAKAENGPEYEVPHYDVGERVKVPAAWMIDQCGFKGMKLGGAQVYPKQPLVIVNATGEATPDEIIALEQRVIGTIRDKYGIELHPEVEHV